MSHAGNNPVGFLQEICQKYNCKFPQYDEINVSGPDHSREFTWKCSFEGFQAQGTSRAKKQAKFESAKAMVNKLKDEGFFDKFNAGSDIDHVDKGIVKSESNKPKTYSDYESKNPISALNEFCQKNIIPPPQFIETSALSTFVCECKVGNKKTYGNGCNKKAAKTEAALKMCVELNIKCSGENLLLKMEKESVQNLKNPISELQEICNQDPFCKDKPEYVELRSDINLFVVKCTLKSISYEGRGTSKKSAKTQAASLVLAAVLAQREKSLNANGVEENNNSATSALSGVTSCGGSYKGSSSAPQVQVALPVFNIESSEEEDEENLIKKPSSPVDKNFNLKLQELKLEPKQEIEDVSKTKSEDASQAYEEPVESSNLN